MKNVSQFKILSILVLVAYLLSACAGAPAAATSSGADKPVAHPVTYLGVIEGINGEAWTINGLTVTVTPDVVRDGPFAVGDQIKVEAVVNPDGSLSISRVEAPSAEELSTLPGLGDDNSNDDNANDDLNSNDENTNDDNSNDNSLNSNDDNTNSSNSNDDNSNDDSNANDDQNDNGNDSNSNDDDDDRGHGSNSNDDDDDDDDDHGGNDNDNG